MNRSHIHIHPLLENGTCYVNCKNFHSINLLIVVNYKECFIYIYAEEAGDLYSLEDDELDNSTNSDNESVLVVDKTREETADI
ncbi:5735_t:CDS:2 [Cetraspora pellucida]|uniref:5735_t:CDS:1 n=1 Tax=Cetraspora pellucida TaxID=1433469 RepID=A0A9N9A9X1_9GLOM|nr:5735_t:CDS:2 [Cetraspora pellucida]